jgi:CheY-like chemotaxis protein
MKMNRRILIVDDREDLRKQLSRLLSHSDSKSGTSSLIQQIRNRISPDKDPADNGQRVTYEIDAAHQGKSAYEMVKDSFTRNEPYALMFLDMRMPPGWNGLETAQRVRSIDKEIQIVIMTAYADYEQQEIVEHVGDPEKLLYLKKPFHPEEIRQLAFAMTENWNINRREKDRLILTNRLLRENSFLTHSKYTSLNDTYRTVLDAFLAFLDTESGIMGRRIDDQVEICAVASSRDEKLIRKRGSDHNSPPVTDEKSGSAYLPLQAGEFDGFVFIPRKSIEFPYDQLNPFLEILSESACDVLKIAFLLHQSSNHGVIRAVGTAVRRVVDSLQATRDQLKDAGGTSADTAMNTLCRDVQARIEEALALTEGIESYCSGHAGKPSRMRHSVAELVSQAIEGERQVIDDAGVHLSSTVAPRVIIDCDGPMIVRALRELLRNAAGAVAAGGSGQRDISITAAYLDDETRIHLAVTDSGLGLDAETSEHLFDAFYTCGDRNGLGATIAKQIVDNHGGEISCNSSPDTGTSIEIILPVG